MSTSFVSICPNCQAKLKLKNPDVIGKRAKCPKCADPFIVKPARMSKSPQAAVATAPASPTRPQPDPPPAAAEDDWLNEDLGSFTTDDDWPPAAPTDRAPAPPLVTGTRKKRTMSAGGRGKSRRPSSDEPSTLVSCLLAIMAGSVAAAIGTTIWITIIVMTGYEIGLVAWAIGGLVGFGTLLGSREHIVGDLSGIIAAVVAFLAVTMPKLLILLLARLFDDVLGFWDLFSPFDALWILLAVGTAFRVASGQAGEE